MRKALSILCAAILSITSFSCSSANDSSIIESSAVPIELDSEYNFYGMYIGINSNWTIDNKIKHFHDIHITDTEFIDLYVHNLSDDPWHDKDGNEMHFYNADEFYEYMMSDYNHETCEMSVFENSNRTKILRLHGYETEDHKEFVTYYIYCENLDYQVSFLFAPSLSIEQQDYIADTFSFHN